MAYDKLFISIYYIMGSNQNKGTTASNKAEDSSFFKKQMVIHSQVLNISQKFTLDTKIGEGTFSTVFKGISVRSGCPRCIKRV